jgi:hypothetical protein
MGKSSGSNTIEQSGNTNSTTQTAPWNPTHRFFRGVEDGKNAEWSPNIEGYLPAIYDDVFQNPAQFYPGQTYADFGPESESALNMLANRGAYGSPVTGAAQNEAMSTMGGDYLSSGNPYFQMMSDRIGDTTQQQVGSRFAGSGRRMGSPAEVQTFSREMSNALAPLAYANYSDERGNMQRAMMASPDLAKTDYTDLNALRQAGAERDAQTQKGIEEDRARWGWQYTEPVTRLSNYGTLLTGIGTLGGTSSGQSTSQSTGYGMANTPGAGPYDYAQSGMSMLPMMMMAF